MTLLKYEFVVNTFENIALIKHKVNSSNYL